MGYPLGASFSTHQHRQCRDRGVEHEERRGEDSVELEAEAGRLAHEPAELDSPPANADRRRSPLPPARAARSSDGPGSSLQGVHALGKAAANQELSVNRANSVRDYLVSHGIAADRITSEGHGPDRSIADNKSAEGRANNRRVEIVVKPGKTA